MIKKYNDQLLVIKNRPEEKQKLEESKEKKNKKFNEAKDFYKNQVKANPEEIKSIQNALLIEEYKMPKWGADGGFGKETFDALFQYQIDNGLKPDGQAGNQTLWKLLGTTQKEFYKWEKIKEKKEAPKNVIENLNIKELNGLKDELKDKTLAVVDGEYFFIPKGEVGNTDAFKKALAEEKGQKSLSLEEVLQKIQKTPGIELAIDGWLFNGQLNEAEKLTLVLSALDRKNEKVLDVNTGAFQKEPVKENKFPILDIPSSDFKDGVYNKAAFEKNLIKALNKVIPSTLKEKWVDLTKEQQKELTKTVNAILKERWIPVGTLKASDIITKNAFFGFSNKAKISDLIKDKNIFENLQVADTIVMKGWLFTNVPKINDKKLYKVVNGTQAVVLSWEKLEELFDENKKYEDATLDSDKRDFKYSEEQNAKDAEKNKGEKKKQKEKEKKESDKIKKIVNDIESQKFSTKDFFGNEVKSAELKWLRRFNDTDVDQWTISLNDVSIDTEKKELLFDFNDALTNDEINSEIVVKGIDIDNFSMKDFRKQVIAQAKERANRKEETKDQDKKNKLKKKK